MPIFDLICLANSYKRRGRCIAGLRTDGGGWIRPSAPTEYGELYPRHYRLQDGSAPQILDVIRVSFEEWRPVPHQPENWLITDEPWQLLHRGLPSELAPVLLANLANGPALLGDRRRFTPFSQFEKHPAAASLALIQPTDLRWAIVCTPDNARKPRALFRLAGTSYNLPVTDPAFLETFRALPLGEHPATACGIGPEMEILLAISLGEPFQDGCCYKLVAAIIPMTEEVPMGRSQAAWIIEALARGVDPYTGEPLPIDGPLFNPDTIRALRAASWALRGPMRATESRGEGSKSA